ncbi:MAG: haloalkane dehalogenase [Deltaproteobacteria bacterium]|nr:haloalkane dehalogenase [Deltaproteobacteria bacterium]MBW2396868.1 haloalkane dehalogenase [Deltaproteobacteria bacterium]
MVLVLLAPPFAASAEGPSAELGYAKKKIEVLGHEMAYIEAGTGRPIVFLHGNPTSSYLWRNVIPHIEGLGRCIAPDLIGMGDSDKLPARGSNGADGRYRFVEHRRYLEAFLSAVGAEEDVILVLHDWGSGLGFDWARRHPGKVRGIAYMEAFLQPLTYSDMGFVGSLGFRALRSRMGEWLILDHNLFVERILPGSVLRGLSEAEMEVYRAPYLEPGESRRATLTWPREVPFDGEPSDTHDAIVAYAAWLSTTTDLPKLWFDVSEGVLVTGARREFAKGLPNQQVIQVTGRHFVQEDAPDEIGRGLANWIPGLD